MTQNNEIVWIIKIHSILKLLYFGKKSYIFETEIKLISESIYFSITHRVIFVSKSVLKIELKDPISFLDKSCIIYRFNCFCDRSYIGHTARHLKSRVIEHIPKCVKKFIEDKTNIKTTAKLNATRRSSISEQLSQ